MKKLKHDVMKSDSLLKICYFFRYTKKFSIDSLFILNIKMYFIINRFILQRECKRKYNRVSL